MRESFDLTRLLSTRALSPGPKHRAFAIGTPLRAITHPRSLTHAQFELDISSSLHYAGTYCSSTCAKTQTHPCTPAFSCTGPTSAYPHHYSTPPRLVAWSPAPALPGRALGGFPRSVYPFSVTLGRYFAPCPSYRVDTTYESTTWPNGDKLPFGPASQLVLQVLCNDAYVPSSKILSIVTCLGRRCFRLTAYSLFALASRHLMTSRLP